MAMRAIFDSLPADQQAAIMAVGEELEPWGMQQAKAGDAALDAVLAKAGIKVSTIDPDMLREWRDLARETAWKGYAAKSAGCANFLKMAEAVTA